MAALTDREMEAELGRIQGQMDKTTDDSLESTRRMLQMTAEGQDVGAKTLVMLDEQGEQLKRTEENMDKMNKSMVEAEQNITQMEKCCGICVCPCNRRPKANMHPNFKNTWGKSAETEINTKGPRRFNPDAETDGGATPSGGYIQRVTNDAREDEMDQNLNDVSGMLSNMKNIAMDMGDEISSHNTRIDNINTKAENLDNRVGAADKRARKLLAS